jgi:hypothetical protein
VVTPSAGVSISGNTITAPAGSYTVTATLGACTSVACASVTVNAQPFTPAQVTVSSVTQPTCLTATGSFTITNYNSSYNYVVTPSAGVSISGNTITAPTGTYTVTATLGACSSVACASVSVNAQPATPAQVTVGSVTQPTCLTATGSFTITNYNSSYTYVVTPSAGVSISGNTITAPTGSYTVTATLGACTSVACDSVTVNAQPAQPNAATLYVTQPTCTIATGTIVITAPTGTGLTYSINNAAYQSGVSFGGLSSGNYSVRVKNAAGCISVATVTIIHAQPATPAQVTVGSVTQPTCLSATGSFTITNYNSSYTYVVTPSAGVSISGNTITAPAGSYTVTATLGACSSVACASVTVNAQPAQPNAATLYVTQPTCTIATGTIVITAPTGTGLTYSINNAAYQSGVSFGGLSSGNYSVRVKNAIGCISVEIVTIIHAQPATPAQVTLGEVTQPTCSTITGSFSITNYNSSYTYVVTPSDGVSISGNTITAPDGVYTVTATLGTCTSIASETITVGLVARFVLAVNLSPNPYTENFSLSLTTCSDEKVSVIVYDMAGKLIEQLEIYPRDAVSLKIGNRYSTGVYNIIVKQGSEMQILRAVKR